MAKLDLEKFGKVWKLAGEGATEGERAAARKRAEAMASKAGLTLEKAVVALTAPAPGQPLNIFAGFDDWMEAREPGHKVRVARERAEREARNAAERAELLAQFGSENAIFERTEREALLAEAVEPIASDWETWTYGEGLKPRNAKRLDGHKSASGIWMEKDITPATREAVTNAYPWPSDLPGLRREIDLWDALRRSRDLFCYEWNHHPEVQCRITLLEHALTCGQPAKSYADICARFAWAHQLEDWGSGRGGDVLAQLERDIAAHDARLRAVNDQALDAIRKLDRLFRETSVEAATTILKAMEAAR